MALTTYTVKRGDNLTKICDGRCGKDVAASISGNTVAAKINTLVSLNKIKNRNLIYVGQVLKLSSSGSSSGASSGSSSAAKPTSNKPKITGFGPRSEDSTGREMAVAWSWTKDGTKGFKTRWTYYDPVIVGWVLEENEVDGYEGNDYYNQSTFTPSSDTATRVGFKVRPYYKDKDNNIKYWSDAEGGWSDEQVYDYADNAPLPPPAPSNLVVDDLTLTMSIDEINAKELDAVSVKFNIVKDNKSSVYTSPAVPINKDPTTGEFLNYVSHQYNKLVYGAEYKVRACSVSAKGKVSGWSDFSENVGTKPSAPQKINVCRADKKSDGSISVHLEWTPVTTATGYTVEYTTREDYFDNASGDVSYINTVKDETSIDIHNVGVGATYYFRVKAIRETTGGNTETSDPSPIISIPVGTPPSAPTTWSSANSAFVGGDMELNWIHNTSDGSRQTYAQLSLKINDNDWLTYTFENTTNETTGERKDEQTFTYGTVVSYKGSLFVRLNTNHVNLNNAKILWKVRTAGITGTFANDESNVQWSVPRTIYIYEKPILELAIVKELSTKDGSATDIAQEDYIIAETIDSFPFYVRAKVELDSYVIQRPIGYHLRIVSNEFYETVDDVGRTKIVNNGDAVYSKYFDTTEELIVEMSANNLDLVSGIPYSVYCTANMSTGLTIENSYDFSVDWVDIEHILDATIDVDTGTYTAVITPRCINSDGNLVDNIELAVYRREYDGGYVEIAKRIPNEAVSVTDPHPSLDYARYRLTAKDVLTGAVSFYDMAGHPVNCPSIIIQWDEEWSTFDVSDNLKLDDIPWTGSLLKLPYNIEVTDNRKREVELINYVGREHPVSYYGTHSNETSTWNVVIPKNDKETVYALRRLSLWTGDVYVREPSGMGYWANVNVSFNQKYDDVTIPVSIGVTRVEGGM